MRTLQKFELVTPTELNSYCVFERKLEDDPLVLFHLTPKSNYDSITENGFLSAASLGTGDLPSVSYAKQSSGCFANKGVIAEEDLVIFAVRFETLEQEGVAVNLSDIHVCKDEIQPVILGYCEVPKGYTIL